LWYGLYALSNLFLLLSFDGLDFQFIYPEVPFLSNISRYVTTGMTYILLFQLLIVFIKEGKSSVAVKILIRSFQIIHLMLLVTSIVTFWYFQYSEWIKIFLFRSLSLLSVVSLIALLVVSFRHYRRGHKASLLFFIAIFILLSGSIEYVLNLNGWRTGLLLFNSVIPSNMQICVILEVLLVFFAVFYRYKLYRDEGSKLRYKLLETESKWREQEIESRNEERKSIAMDIHDGIGSRLFGARMKLESILLKQGLDDQEFNSISGELTLISKELKNVILSLSKDENSARAQITALAEKLSDLFSHSSMKMDFKIELHDEEFQSGFILDVQLIFLELANNVLKYSNCEKVEASLLVKENQVILCWVECPEIPTHRAGDGLGLRSISKRFKRWQGHREDLLFPYHYKLIFQKQWVVKKDN
jgi:signal transduction histidine kinase